MLSVMYGVLAMIPMTFGIAGYVMVSRNGAVPNPHRHASASNHNGID